ncbi:apolipoprotein N-acyltransferase [Rhodococcus sp. BP-241]|uniref:apolipoprotein N-acyltransferase n=1 Tax=Rhodococcus sp. BP-241 TaxID=2739441 RepID=UPI001C9B6196|nr:apolipoprotein N-acyltransferase [Rhodococcus sp. BP-241]MBY6709154.1 apolipoprotein N-acyltransferase [Rhodococcus sp. BP-241]
MTTETLAAGDPARSGARPGDLRARALRALLVRGGGAALSGGLLWAGFPPRDWWFLAVIALAILTAVLRGVGVRAGAAYGAVAGAAFFVPLLPWVGEYVGAAPWLALAVIQAGFVALFGAAAAALWRLPAAPLWIACAWVGAEAVRSRVPFGGLPWGRTAFGQAEGPLLPLAAWVGAPGIGFVVALVGAATTAAAAEVMGRRRVAQLIGPLGAMALVLALTAAAATATTPQSAPADRREVTLALVQGNVPRAGLDFNAQRRAVLDNHVARTLELAADIDAGRALRPSLVIWPENSSDIDPLRNPDAAAAITGAARAVGVPILVGAVLRRGDGTTTNTSMVWDPVTGPADTHDKRQLVPFGEYLPLRPLVTALVPSAARAGNFVPGNGDGVVEIAGLRVAVATCYEVAFDALVTDAVRTGAQLIAVPTNNATFGRTEMTYQQLAMSRVRAVEHGRSVVVSATSGVSAIIDPTGEVTQRTDLFTPAALVATLPLGDELTLATRLGSAPEGAATAAAVLALIAASIAARRTRRGTPNPAGAPAQVAGT